MYIYIYAHSHLQLFYILFILLHNIFPYKVLTYNIIFDDIIFYSITLYWSSLLDIVSKDKKTLKMICIQTGKEWFSVPTCLQASALEIRECRRHILGCLRKGLADRPRKTALDHHILWAPLFFLPEGRSKIFTNCRSCGFSSWNQSSVCTWEGRGPRSWMGNEKNNFIHLL